MEHENMWRQENTRTCKDERTRERVWGQESKRTCGDKETKKMWRHGTQERVETRERENMWLKKKVLHEIKKN